MEDNLVEQQAFDMPERTSALEENFHEVISSDDESLKRYFDLADKIVDEVVSGRDQWFELAKKFLEASPQMLDRVKTEEERAKIMKAMDEILKKMDEKEKEAREYLEKVSSDAYHKDSEKRQFNWGALTITALAIAGAGIGVAVYLANREEGDGHLKLPPSGL